MWTTCVGRLSFEPDHRIRIPSVDQRTCPVATQANSIAHRSVLHERRPLEHGPWRMKHLVERMEHVLRLARAALFVSCRSCLITLEHVLLTAIGEHCPWQGKHVLRTTEQCCFVETIIPSKDMMIQ